MPSEIKATPETLRIIARLGKVIEALPPVFPTEEAPVVRPLAIGIRDRLHELVKPPEDMPTAKAHAIVADALKSYARSSEYREALAMPGALRFDLDGTPVEPVATDHAEFARKIKTQRPTGPVKESIAVKVTGIKISVPFPADQLHAVAETVKTVDLTLDLGDGKPFLVPFSGKNYRRALRQADELRANGAEVIVVLQGRLVAGHRVEGAGLAVQAKTVKQPAD